MRNQAKTSITAMGDYGAMPSYLPKISVPSVLETGSVNIRRSAMSIYENSLSNDPEETTQLLINKVRHNDVKTRETYVRPSESRGSRESI